MPSADQPNSRKPVSQRNDLHDARPLLQAIFIGIVLATALVAAAALTGSDATSAARAQHVPISTPSVPHP